MISIATRNAARFLEVEEDVGVVAEGRRADLVVLSANPLENISNTKAVDAVFRLVAASISEQGSACGLRSNKPMVAWTTFCSLLRLVGYVGELPDVLSPPLYAGASGEL